jgi:hypothetical protein
MEITTGRMRLVFFLVGVIAFAHAFAARYPATGPGDCVTDQYGKSICPPADVTCMADITGKIFCSPPKGSIVQDVHGEAVCGLGPCVPDRYGEVYCAPDRRSAAFIDDDGKVNCSGGCVKASKSLCRTPDELK